MSNETDNLRARVTAWLVPGLCVAGIAGLGGLAELVLDRLDEISDEFFRACAGIAPVLGLALFIEIAVVMKPVVTTNEPDPSTGLQQTVRLLVRSNALLIVLSESAALYAVGAQATSTFLVVCVVVPWLVQLLILVDTSYYRIGVNRIGRR